MEVFPTGAHPEHRGSVLVLPAVAFANIGELAVDAVIATLKLQRIAVLDDPSVLPCIGNNPYQLAPPGQMVSALELYGSAATAPFFLLQQRAPAATGLQGHYAKSAAAWAVRSGFRQVVMVAGLDAQYRREAQLEGSTQLRWLSQGEIPEGPRAALGIPELEQEALDTEKEVHGLLPPWPLWEELAEAKLPCILLSKFASEGDNMADALQLAEKLLQLLQVQGLVPTGATEGADAGGGSSSSSGLKLQVPCSWAALYGGKFSGAAAGDLAG